MASPLTFYVQIHQDQTSQDTARKMVANFATMVKELLDKTEIVHYASLALIPNPATSPGGTASGAMGLLLLTNFDLAMNPYLKVFYDDLDINKFLNDVALIAYNPVPALNTFSAFQKFIVGQNLTPTPPSSDFSSQFYQAYPDTVNQIKNA